MKYRVYLLRIQNGQALGGEFFEDVEADNDDEAAFIASGRHPLTIEEMADDIDVELRGVRIIEEAV